MIGHGFRGMLSGFGSIVAPSVTTTGAIVGASVEATTGAVTATLGAVVAGSTVTAATGLTVTSGTLAAGAATFSNDVQLTGANAKLRLDCGSTHENVLVATALSGNVTGWDPGGGSGANLYKYGDIHVTSDAARVINTMIRPPQGYRLRIRIWNKNTDAARTITLLHDDGATGTATERFFAPGNANLVIPVNGFAEIYSDVFTSNRWAAAGVI